MPISQSSDKNKGFTLVELLVAITIVAILSMIALTLYSSSQKSARDAKRKEDINAISKALEQYKTAKGSYPTGCADAWSGDTHTEWNLTTCGLTGYMKELPKDPINYDNGDCDTKDGCHLYRLCVSSDGSSYVVGVNLEDGADQGAPTDCGLAGSHRFWIPNQL